MSLVLEKIREVDPNDSDVAKEVVTNFFQHITKKSSTDAKIWLSALTFVINRFPRFCMSHRNSAENYLITFIDSKSPSTVIEAAKALHALQQVRPLLEKSATAKSCWREQMNVLCIAAHKLLSVIFSRSVDIYHHKGKSKVDLQSLSHSPFAKALINIVAIENSKNDPNKITVLMNRLKNVFIFMQAMLVEVFPAAKPVRPQTIFDVIVRALSVTSGKSQDIKNIADISTVKIQALRTLDALVASMGSNLIPFSGLVIRLAMQTLRWTTENQEEEYKPVRCAAYSSITRWLIALRSDPGDSGKWHDELTTNIVADTSTRPHTQIVINAQPSLKNLSKKAKRKMQSTMLQQSSIANHMPSERNKVSSVLETNDPVVLAALSCAESFLTVCGAFLKPEIHQLLQNHIILEISRSSYTYGLLRTLQASNNTCVTVPPPTQYCVALYAKFASSSDEKVSKFCIAALQNVRLHLHCSPPSLNFALDIPKETTISKEKQKSVSERNKATLEALLGSKQMPVNHVEETIDLDEPTCKKTRLDEDITDRISLSSDSNKSIEISDTSDQEDIQIDVIDADVENIETIKNNVHDTELVIEENDVSQITENGLSSQLDATTQESFTSKQTTIDNIFDAKTQLPFDASNDTVDGEDIPLSMEVAYDLPSTGKEAVPVLEKMDDENLPSTNDTDDVHITCGQLTKNSEDEGEKKDDIVKDTPKVNGIATSPIKDSIVLENGDAKILSGKEVTVEDMLADFVDEVNDESNVQV